MIILQRKPPKFCTGKRERREREKQREIETERQRYIYRERHQNHTKVFNRRAIE